MRDYKTPMELLLAEQAELLKYIEVLRTTIVSMQDDQVDSSWNDLEGGIVWLRESVIEVEWRLREIDSWLTYQFDDAFEAI